MLVIRLEFFPNSFVYDKIWVFVVLFSLYVYVHYIINNNLWNVILFDSP